MGRELIEKYLYPRDFAILLIEKNIFKILNDEYLTDTIIEE